MRTVGAKGPRAMATAPRPIPLGHDAHGRAVGAASAVINLTGASMAGGSWTDAYKQEIRDSRVRTTQMLVEAQPRVLLQASAVGIYGDGGDTVLTESSPVGKTFLADVAREWETAASAARGTGSRKRHLWQSRLGRSWALDLGSGSVGTSSTTNRRC